MRALVERQLRDRRSSLIGWTLGWLTLIGMYVATWPTVRAHGQQYDDILKDLPAALRSAVGSQSDGAFSTPAGYFTAELLAVTGPVVAMTMGVLLGANALARGEEDGTLELLAAQPVSRSRLLASRLVEAVVELVAVLVVAGTGLYLLGRLVDLHLDLVTCLRSTVMLALLGAEGMSLALLVGAATGRSARARAAAGGAGLLVFLLNALGPSISWLSGAVAVSPFQTLVASDPFRRVPPVLSVTTLVLPTLLLTAGAWWAFRRRDLRFA